MLFLLGENLSRFVPVLWPRAGGGMFAKASLTCDVIANFYKRQRLSLHSWKGGLKKELTSQWMTSTRRKSIRNTFSPNVMYQITESYCNMVGYKTLIKVNF
jgi:hypothetical protein